MLTQPCPHCATLQAELNALKEQLHKNRDKTPYDTLRKAVEDKFGKRNNIRRKVTDNLKWDLRIRYITEITDEQLPAALEYVRDYEIGE